VKLNLVLTLALILTFSPGEKEQQLAASGLRPKSAGAITIDESTGKVFLNVDRLAQSNGSLKTAGSHLPGYLTCSI
jgi:hypothetical protein